jgi:hypothetical protein
VDFIALFSISFFDNPLVCPASFAIPSSFRFEVVMVNKTEQVISQEQKKAPDFTEDSGDYLESQELDVSKNNLALEPERVTEGDTVDEVLVNEKDAFASVLEIYEDLGKPLPLTYRLWTIIRLLT